MVSGGGSNIPSATGIPSFPRVDSGLHKLSGIPFPGGQSKNERERSDSNSNIAAIVPPPCPPIPPVRVTSHHPGPGSSGNSVSSVKSDSTPVEMRSPAHNTIKEVGHSPVSATSATISGAAEPIKVNFLPIIIFFLHFLSKLLQISVQTMGIGFNYSHCTKI